MIVKGQRLDLTNTFQVITLEVTDSERLPEDILQFLVIPLGQDGRVLPGWTLMNEMTDISITRKPNSIRIILKTDLVTPSVHELLFILHAEKANMIRMKLDKMGEMFIRVNHELFDLTPDLEGRALIAFSVYRRGPIWRFRAIGEAYKWGLEEIYPLYGIDPKQAPHHQS